jgi:hypothetical protein
MKNKDYRTLNVKYANETDKAWLFYIKRRYEKVSYWFPKSQIEIIDITHNRMTDLATYTIIIPIWLYKKTFGLHPPINEDRKPAKKPQKKGKKKKQNPRARIFYGLNTNSM